MISLCIIYNSCCAAKLVIANTFLAVDIRVPKLSVPKRKHLKPSQFCVQYSVVGSIDRGPSEVFFVTLNVNTYEGAKIFKVHKRASAMLQVLYNDTAEK